MLEIIALIFLTRKIGKLAYTKGLKPLTWKIYTIVAWIIAEVTGIIVALMMFDKDNLVSIVGVGLMFAFTGYLFVNKQLNKFPDKGIDDDINNIGHY
jgi:hypothetical protein